MSSVQSVQYALFLHDNKPPNPDRVVTGLNVMSRFTHADATMMARRAFGVLIDCLSREDATALRESLADAGVYSDATEQKWLRLPRAKVCRRATLTPNALRLIDIYERGTDIPWTRVVVVAAGVYPQSQRVRLKGFRREVAPSGVTVWRAAEYGTAQIEHPVLELILQQPAERIRIVSNKFDYSHLGARQERSAGPNFAMFVTEVARHAYRAVNSRGTDQLLSSARAVTRYPDVGRFEREICWLLWRHHGPGRRLDDQGSPYRRLASRAEARSSYEPPSRVT